jgi:hypothetical protein
MVKVSEFSDFACCSTGPLKADVSPNRIRVSAKAKSTSPGHPHHVRLDTVRFRTRTKESFASQVLGRPEISNLV